ncbi:MFS transporter [Streptomyces umbrinus]|uniref:MFS transporter n=1 Tax=Streptomyces umbrinus TaxID=67370 RepID=UPI003445B5D5
MNRNFERDVLREAFSIFGPLLGIATVAGPILGGFLVDAAGWRFMFLIDIALSIAAFVAPSAYCPPARASGPPSSTYAAPDCSR